MSLCRVHVTPLPCPLCDQHNRGPITFVQSGESVVGRTYVEDHKDAERYRWLKANAVRVEITTETQMFSLYGKDLDKVIDVASASTDILDAG